MKTIKKPALIVVDYQYDFASPQWALSVKEWKTIGYSIKQLVDLFTDKWRDVIYTWDKHPQWHISFASTHWVSPYTIHEWDIKRPDHCIDGTLWAELHPPLHNEKITIKKAYTKDFDTYSAFGWTTLDESQTLDEYLQAKDITDLYVTWLATDYCVWDTALGSKNPEKVINPYNTTLIIDAIKWVNPETTTAKINTMKKEWIILQTTAEAINILIVA
jgi:nicotinamidase/pyrazinamidase